MYVYNPLIERYYTSTRTQQTLQLARLARFAAHPTSLEETTSLRQAVQLSHALHEQAYQRADKYQLTTSALAMISYLQPDPGRQTVIFDIPELPTWMETEQGAILAPHRSACGIFLWKPAHPALADTVQLAVVNAAGHTFLHFAYHEQHQRWGFSALHTCPFQTCQHHGWQGFHLFAEPHLRPCRKCREALDHWQAWCSSALLVIQGVFAEEEEDRPRLTLTAPRTPLHAQLPGSQETPIEHHYRVITFDACIKRHRAHTQAKQQPGESSDAGPCRGPAVDPAMMAKVTRRIAAGTRHLDPAICSRWKSERTVPVCGHTKGVWIRLDLLKRRFTRVIASKFLP
jgi:hypothetical protein